MPKNSTRKATSPAVTPTATIRNMIVCVPGDLPRESLTAHQLDRNFGVQGTLSPRFWASPALHLWQRSQMFGLRKGRPAYCAAWTSATARPDRHAPCRRCRGGHPPPTV